MQDLIALRNNLTQFYKDGKIDEPLLNMNLKRIDEAIEDFNYYKARYLVIYELYSDLLEKLLNKITED